MTVRFGATVGQAAKAAWGERMNLNFDQIEAALEAAKEVQNAYDKLAAIVGGKRTARHGRKSASKSKPGARVDWSAILAGLPKRFTVADILKDKGAASKGKAQVYPALTRWAAAKLVRNVGRGEYEKVSATPRSKPKAAKSARTKAVKAKAPKAKRERKPKAKVTPIRANKTEEKAADAA